MTAGAPRPIVLVPGACLGGWAWRQVAIALRERGHDVYPVTLTGLGERAHLARPEIDLETHITDVVNVLEFEALEDVVLVGHSYAGAVVSGAGERARDRLQAVVYLDTAPPAAGAAIVDMMPEQTREQQRRDVVAHGDGWRWPVPDREALESGAFGSTSGLAERHFKLLAERATPQPYATFTSPLVLSAEQGRELRRVGILCSAGGVTLDALRALIADGDPRAAAFADPRWELHELATGHWAMFSAPDELAALLALVAAPQT